MVHSCMCVRVRERVPAGIAIVVTPFGSAFQVAAALVVYSADSAHGNCSRKKVPNTELETKLTNRAGMKPTCSKLEKIV